MSLCQFNSLEAYAQGIFCGVNIPQVTDLAFLQKNGSEGHLTCIAANPIMPLGKNVSCILQALVHPTNI